MKSQWITRIEWTVAALLSIAVLILLSVRATHAGGLWRDECGTVQLALMPDISDILKNFQHQTLPPLFPLVIRFYARLFGTSNASLQALRLLVGAALLGVAWFNSRMLEHRAPLTLLALFGLNSTFLFWGGYALLEVALILAFGLSVKLLLQPPGRGIIAAGLAGILSVQLLINNLVLVLAMYLSAALACLILRFYRLAAVFIGIALCCAVSDIVYLKVYAAADWAIVLKVPSTFQSIWNDFHTALGRPYSILQGTWYALFFATIVGACWQLVITLRRQSRQPVLLLFGILLSVLAPLAYFISVSLAGRLTHPRHFLPLVALLAATLDLLIAELASINWVRLARLGVAFAALLFVPAAVWPEMIKRQTNIDIVAQTLEQDAGRHDLIVVNPSSLGISFNWYYHGAAPWITIPPIQEHRIHRYDLVKSKMLEPDPLRDVRSAIRQTLESGNRVWIVGGARPPEENLPLSLPPAPDLEFGWSARAYSNVWSLQLGDFLKTHVELGNVVISPASDVSDTENVPLLVAQGWRD